MRRRDLLAALGGIAAVVRPALGKQQQQRVIGLLSNVSPDTYTAFIAAMRTGLAETGYVEGHNLTIEYRWAEDRIERLPELAQDLVRRNVEVIVASGYAPRAARQVTSTIPIVFIVARDPVATGLVRSFQSPGGNITGIAFMTYELIPKRLELLHELVPEASRIALLINPNTPDGMNYLAPVQHAAQEAGVQLHVLEARSESDFEPAFSKFAALQAGALLVGTDPLFTENRRNLVDLASRYAIPASYAWREFVEAGGLISYGTNLGSVYRQAGIYAGRVLNGTKPGDLPVQQPTKLELVINLKTAKALGLTVPQSLIARAEEVIE
jgi:putative ABC transport system substrate-binding protein